jgi:hypothetical protein
MSIPEFQYYLRYEDTGAYKYYTVVNGAVTVTLTETPIVYAPKNWNTAKKEWERGFTYYGIFTIKRIKINLHIYRGLLWDLVFGSKNHLF